MTGILVFAPEIGRRPPLTKRRPPGRFFVELWELLQQLLHNGKTLLIGKKLL